MVGRLVVAFEVDWLSPILENISHDYVSGLRCLCCNGFHGAIGWYPK